MGKVIYFFLFIILFLNITSCSTEKGEEKKTEVITKKESINTTTEKTYTGNITQEKKKNIPKYKEETKSYKDYEVYPWELLKDKKFKELYLKSIDNLANIPWIRNMSGVASKNKVIKINGKEYVYISFCKPHFCDTEMVYILYSPKDNQIFGAYLIENDNEYVKIPIGKLSEENIKVLAEAVKKDINSFITGDIILSSNSITTEDLGIEDLKPCPIFKKVKLKEGDTENLKNIAYLVFKKFIKEEDINIKELKEELGLEINLKNLLIGISDLNDDNKKDIISILYFPFMCGNAGCPGKVYIKVNKDYKSIDIPVLIENLDYVYISKEKHKGVRDLIVNDRLILKYDGTKYIVGGKCYVQ